MDTYSIFGILKERLFGPNVRVLAFPVLIIAALIILILFVVKTGYARVSLRLEDLQAAQKDEAVLEQKLEILQEIERGILAQTDVSLIAMPDKNPALWVIGQLKGTAQANSVFLHDNKLRSGSKDETGLTKIALETTGEGGLGQIFGFLRAIDSLAPVFTIERVRIEENKGIVSANLKLFLYWADLPTRLPPLTDPIKRLTAQEEEIFAKIAKLKRPSFTVLKPSQPSIRESPFN